MQVLVCVCVWGGGGGGMGVRMGGGVEKKGYALPTTTTSI